MNIVYPALLILCFPLYCSFSSPVRIVVPPTIESPVSQFCQLMESWEVFALVPLTFVNVYLRVCVSASSPTKKTKVNMRGEIQSLTHRSASLQLQNSLQEVTARRV